MLLIIELVVLPRPGEPHISRASSSVGVMSQHKEQSWRRADTKKINFPFPRAAGYSLWAPPGGHFPSLRMISLFGIWA